MRYKLLAPVRTNFSIVSESPILDPVGYTKFWNKVASRKDEFLDFVAKPKDQRHGRLTDHLSLSEKVNGIRFPHSHYQSPFNRYRSLTSDSLERPLHVLEIQLDRDAFDASVQAKRGRHVERLVWRIFDHEISLLEVDISLGDYLHAVPSEEIPTVLDTLQQTGIVLGERLAHRCTDRLLRHLFDWLRDFEGSADYIESNPETRADYNESDPETREHATNGAMPVLWVTRTLIFEEGDNAHPHRKTIIRHWLKDTVELEAAKGKKQIDQVVNCEKTHLTRWLNYLFREDCPKDPDQADAAGQDKTSASAKEKKSSTAEEKIEQLDKPFCDEWEAMLYAQFFYGAFEIVDHHLTNILAQSLARDRRVRVNELRSRLQQNIRKADLLLIHFHDSDKYYKRTVKSKLDNILKGWNFETVLVEPVRKKITSCLERLTLLHERNRSKSEIQTDLILGGIGLTSIFALFLALAEYWRTMMHDPDSARYELSSPWLLYWFASLPTDVILVGALIPCLFLIAWYLRIKRQTL